MTKAFAGCDCLTSIVIGNGVTEFGSEAFDYCPKLKSVYITDIAAWCKIKFYGKYSNPLYQGAKLYIKGVEATRVNIPDGVTSISSLAFYGCRSLLSVTIPSSVSKIGSYAFYGCSSLNSVYCKAITPPSSEDDVFYRNASNRKIYVPTASVGSYTRQEWGNSWRHYSDSIVGYDF